MCSVLKAIAKAVTIEEILAVPQPPQPAAQAPAPSLKTGDLVTLKCWLYQASQESNGDYRLQLAETPRTVDKSVAAYIPSPQSQYVQSTAMREFSAIQQQWVKEKLAAGGKALSRPV